MAVPEVSGTETVSVGRASVESVLLRCDSERPQPGTGDALYQQPKGTCVTKGNEVQGMKVASGYGVARGEADVKTKGRSFCLAPGNRKAPAASLLISH